MSNAARDFAERYHRSQVDKGGRPYIEHLAAVVGILCRRWPDAPAFAVEAAWLHDTLEDTDATPLSLAQDGVSPEAIILIQQLTRDPGVEYLRWIKALSIAGSKWAIRIKLADNEHNSDPSRALSGDDMAERRYAPARAILEAADG